MAITADQTAILELLLAGGQDYSELADLLGMDEAEVRTRARAALTELGDADPDRNVGLTDYLLGQADPIGRADAVRHLRSDAADHALATAISDRLASNVAGAELPKLPPAPGGGRFMGRAAGPAPVPAPAGPRTAAPGSSRRLPGADLSQRQTRLVMALGAGAVILIAIVLGVTGVFDSEDDPPAADPTAAAPENGAGAPGDSPPGTEIPDGEELSRVPLTAVGNGDAQGAAIVGLATGDQPYLDLIIENLEPVPREQAYVVWFMFDESRGYPLSPIFPEEGSFSDRFAIPQAVTSLIARTQSIEVSLSDSRETLATIQEAAEAGTFAIEQPGRTILAGDVPESAEAGGEGTDGAPGAGEAPDESPEG